MRCMCSMCGSACLGLEMMALWLLVGWCRYRSQHMLPSQKSLLSCDASACHSCPFDKLPQQLLTPHIVCRASWGLGVEASLDKASLSWQLPCQVCRLCFFASCPYIKLW